VALDSGENFISGLLSQADWVVQVQLCGKSLIARGILFEGSRQRVFGWSDLFRFRNIWWFFGAIPIFEEVRFSPILRVPRSRFL
jgi:hypothetical protein